MEIIIFIWLLGWIIGFYADDETSYPWWVRLVGSFLIWPAIIGSQLRRK